MAYRLKRREAVETALRRIARGQFDKALAETAEPDLDTDDTVHQERKRCKKLRALLRPALGSTCRRENIRLRDTARDLARLRGAATVAQTLDAVHHHYAAALDDEAFAPLREQLLRRRDRLAPAEAGNDNGGDSGLEACADRLRAARERVDGWRLDAVGRAAVGGGLAKTYRQGRRALKQATRAPDTAVFHDGRKRAKYQLPELRLTTPA